MKDLYLSEQWLRKQGYRPATTTRRLRKWWKRLQKKRWIVVSRAIGQGEIPR